MAKVCFCGCGRKVPFGRGAMNTSGRRVLMAHEDLRASEAAMRQLDDTSNYDKFIAAGEVFVSQLRDVVHGDAHPSVVDTRSMREWLRLAWKALPSVRVTAAALAAGQDRPSRQTSADRPNGGDE